MNCRDITPPTPILLTFGYSCKPLICFLRPAFLPASSACWFWRQSLKFCCSFSMTSFTPSPSKFGLGPACPVYYV